MKPGGTRRVADKAKNPEFLTDAELFRREAFAQAYCAHGVIRQATSEAGYQGKPHNLTRTGQRLLHEPAVKDRIAEIRKDLMQELGITQRFVLSRLMRIASFDIGKCFDEDTGEMLKAGDIPEDTRLALAAYEIEEKTFGSGEDAMTVVNRKVKAHSQLDALDKLGKHLNMFQDNTKATTVDAQAFLQLLLDSRARALEMRSEPVQPVTQYVRPALQHRS